MTARTAPASPRPGLLRGLRALLPAASDYRELPRSWRGDVLAGVTVGIVALPLALAFGVSSGAGAEAGLVTAIVAGVVAAVFGGSSLQVSGPTGAMVVVLGPIVASHGVAVLAPVSVLAGVVVLAAGALRLGRLVGYIPWPVIEGFTLGIAVIIFLQQVPSVVGVAAVPGENAVLGAVRAVASAQPGAWWTLGIAAVVAAVMLLAPRLHPRLPGSLLAIALVSVAAVALRLPVATIAELPAGLPAPRLPVLDLTTLGALAGPACAVAALAAIESLLSARVAAGLSSAGAYDPNRELVGQGLASVAAGLFGGMPATGAIARTAVNARSGARTRLAAVVHALVLLAVVYVAGGVVAAIPLAALAGVLMVTAVRMVSLATVRAVVGSTPGDAIAFCLTAVVTVSVDLVYAVLIGIAVAAVFLLRALASASGVHREEIPGPAVAGDERIAIFRFEGALFFGGADRILERITSVDGVEVVILRMSQLQLLDTTGAQALAEIIGALERRGVTVLVKGIAPRHQRLARRLGVTAAVRHPNHLFTDLGAAVAHARHHVA